MYKSWIEKSYENTYNYKLRMAIKECIKCKGADSCFADLDNIIIAVMREMRDDVRYEVLKRPSFLG